MMSARELEQAELVQSERRMSIMNEVHDMITAKEKQATQSGICFSCGINEQTSDEIGQRALKAQVCEYDIISRLNKG